MLKTGQTIKIDGRWGIVTYLIGDREAVVTFDDDRQVQVGVEDLVPVLMSSQSTVAQKERPGQCIDCQTPVAAGSRRCYSCNGVHAVSKNRIRGGDIVLNPITHPGIPRGTGI